MCSTEGRIWPRDEGSQSPVPSYHWGMRERRYLVERERGAEGKMMRAWGRWDWKVDVGEVVEMGEVSKGE